MNKNVVNTMSRNGEYLNGINRISEMFSEEAIMLTAAEEAVELNQAILKLLRVRYKSFPSHMTEEKAREDVIKELSDISVFVLALIDNMKCADQCMERAIKKEVGARQRYPQ